MALYSSTSQAGNREDLINIVTRVAYDETPLLSSIGKSKATGTLHEWMEESLAAPTFNAEVEGAAAAFGAVNPRVRKSNHCQISRKTGEISDTQQALLKAGVSDEYGRQLEIATIELARDIERAHWQGANTAGAARTSGGVSSFVTTNVTANGAVAVTGTATAGAASTISLLAAPALNAVIVLTGGTGAGQIRRVLSAAALVATVDSAWDVVPDATSTYAVYASIAMVEARLNDAVQTARDAGGKPNCVYVDGFQKRAISGFAAVNRQFVDNTKTLTNSIDIYESDFGPLAIKYDRWAPIGTAAIVDEKSFSTAWLRPIKAEELARVGSSRRFMIEGEFCLEARGEIQNAMVYGAL